MTTANNDVRRGSMGLVYRHAAFYRIAMRVLEGRERTERLRRITDAIPAGSEVVDLCCGSADVARLLENRGCRYIGLDINRAFVRNGRRRGIDVRLWDAESMAIPAADVVCMFSSFYHFIPREQELFDRMIANARRLVVISEPVRNWATSGSPILRATARALTRVNGRNFEQRHTETSLRSLIAKLPPENVELTLSGRDVLIFVRTDGQSS